MGLSLLQSLIEYTVARFRINPTMPEGKLQPVLSGCLVKCESTPKKFPLSLSFMTIPAPRIQKNRTNGNSSVRKQCSIKTISIQLCVLVSLCLIGSNLHLSCGGLVCGRYTFTVIRRKGGKGGENWPLSQTFLHDSFPFLPLSPRPHPNTVVETSFKVNVGNMPPPSLPPACCPVLFWRGGEGERLILSVGTTQQGAFLAIVHCARPEVRYKCKSVGSRGNVGHRRCACCAGRDITFSSTTC